MKHYRFLLAFLLYCAALVLLSPATVVSARALEAHTEIQEPETQDPTGIPEEEPPSADLEAHSWRRAKNARYNGAGTDLTSIKPGTDAFFEHVWPAIPAVPIAESTCVVVGTVVKMQPYLSEDRSRIYTELSVRAESVIKCDVHDLLSPGKLLAVDVFGGALRTRSGQIMRDNTRVEFLGKPYVGGRFVLFATRIHDNNDLAMIRGYELRDGKVYQLTEHGSPGRKLFTRSPGEPDPLSQEGLFLEALELRCQ
jgi:hypothetical protein